MANIENPPQNIKPQQKTEKRPWIDGNYKFETIRDKGIYKKTSLITGKVSYVAHVTNPHTVSRLKGRVVSWMNAILPLTAGVLLSLL